MKFLIPGFVVAISSLFAQVDREGWAWVEPSPKSSFRESLEIRDLRRWVVFYKTFQGESFWISFPQDPRVEEKEGGLELASSLGQGEFSLQVEVKKGLTLDEKGELLLKESGGRLLPNQKKNLKQIDIFCEKSGKKAKIRLIETPSHFFILKESANEGGFSDKFFPSFGLNS